MSDRIAIFIDGGYLDKVTEELGFFLDMKKFVNKIVNNRAFLRAYYYHCLPYQSNPPTSDERTRYAKKSRFFDFLKRLDRVEVRLGTLLKRDSTFVQKSADILLAVDLVRLSTQSRIGTAYLVAGDSDFVPAVQTA
ncbi:MAG: NYN domain-containing protein [Deltaproteobacteria bacterium]|nr:NYN domain-containing protein [Deltaproteobacteria bacterium]MBW2051464.1 NYN domain-containing protein [Deltaproteobacteria bacterium]MBW2140574.1 NYN domain-containing protein [Deltaproteobacteria bacterium]